MNNSPLVSIIIPCLNSEKTLHFTLDSLRSQDIDQIFLEILIVDAGSTDATREIAQKYGAKVIENPRVQPECAKHEGILHARGKYALFIDSDEAFLNNSSITQRVKFLEENKNCHIVLTDGYLKPDGYSDINDYMNIFSDPFSFFMYGKYSAHELFLRSWKRYPRISDTDNGILFVIRPNIDTIPLVDLCAGNTIDLEYVKKTFAKDIQDVNIIPELFSKLASLDKQVGVVRKSPIWHYSGDSLSRYVHKLRWRVVVNTHYADIVGVGFSNRIQYQNSWFTLKKYLFLPYSFLFLPAFLLGLYFALCFRRPILVLHGFLTWYVGAMIVWYMTLNILRIKPPLPKYGQK